MYIRRDRSALYFGKRSPRRRIRWIFGAWFVSMGLVMAAIWQWSVVEAQINVVLNGPPSPTPDGFELAKLAEEAYWDGRLTDSIALYAQAAALEPDDMGLQFEYVRNLIYASYEGRGFTFRAREALNVAEAAVERAPNDARAQAAYAFALVSEGRGDEAVSAALNAVELAPEWAEAHAYLSLAYQQQLRWQAAQQEGQRAVALNPLSVDARRALALSLTYTGDFDIAIQQYEQAIQVHPKLDALYFEVAIYYIGQENYDAAILAYDRVLQNNRRNVKAWTRKCEAFFRQREDAKARESCEQAVELDSSFPDAHKQLGMVRYTSRNFEGAVESFDTCIALMEAQNWAMDDRLVECYYINGLANYYLADCAKAMPLFNEALLVNTTELSREFTYTGMNLCAQSDPSISIQTLPTPAPEPTQAPQPIGVY